MGKKKRYDEKGVEIGRGKGDGERGAKEGKGKRRGEKGTEKEGNGEEEGRLRRR